MVPGAKRKKKLSDAHPVQWTLVCWSPAKPRTPRRHPRWSAIRLEWEMPWVVLDTQKKAHKPAMIVANGLIATLSPPFLTVLSLLMSILTRSWPHDVHSPRYSFLPLQCSPVDICSSCMPRKPSAFRQLGCRDFLSLFALEECSFRSRTRYCPRPWAPMSKIVVQLTAVDCSRTPV